MSRESILVYNQPVFFPIRLMVGQVFLEHRIVVRVHIGEHIRESANGRPTVSEAVNLRSNRSTRTSLVSRKARHAPVTGKEGVRFSYEAP